jgi:hypothetical protein
MARAKPEKMNRQYVNPDEGPVVTGAKEAPGQETLFGADEEFHRYWQEWQGMPEFVHGDLEPSSSIIVHFAKPEDRRAFIALVEQPAISPLTRSIWYPRAERAKMFDKRWRDANAPAPADATAELDLTAEEIS